MRVAVGSAFRNMGPRVMPYMERVAALRDFLEPNPVRIIAAEGDSTDTTRAQLVVAASYHELPIQFVECTHGQRVFGSTEEQDRMVALSKVGNAIFAGVNEQDDVLVYVESDLMWDPQTITSLIHDALARRDGFDIFAPMIMAGTAFYDIFAFRGLDGARWTPFKPYHPDFKEGLVEVSSVGSCLVMRCDVARRCRIRNEFCLIGWSEDARMHGYRLAVRTDLKVRQL